MTESVIKTVRVSEGMVQVIIPDYIPPDDPVLLRAREMIRERCSPEALAAFERQAAKWSTPKEAVRDQQSVRPRDPRTDQQHI